MGIAIGVIGAGIMGSAHARLFSQNIRDAALVAVADQNIDAANAAAGPQGRSYQSGFDLIADPAVEAVLIASPDQTHFDLVTACLDAGKPVLCEKPLAMTADEALELATREAAMGQTLIHVGFMRRFDPAYRALKDQLLSGAIGQPRIVHNIHRNTAAPDWFTAHMALTNSAVHEFDICRWLLDTDYTDGRLTIAPAMGDAAAGDPMLITCETRRGTIVSTEVFMNAHYGYHVHCEIAGSLGNATMAHPDLIRLRRDFAERAAFPENWVPRFADAYRLQNQAWVDGLTCRIPHEAATAWDGFAATFIAEALVKSASTRDNADLRLPAKPTAKGN